MTPSHPARFQGLACGLLLAAALSGCDRVCGDSLYPTQSDIGADGKPLPQTGWVRTYSEADYNIYPLDPKAYGVRIVREVRAGDGRFAQATRQMTVSFTARDEAGRELGSGTVRFLYPPVSYGGSMANRVGRVPDSFANGLAGMREGGERVFTAPAERDEYRAFMDHGSMRNVFSLPETGRLTYQVTLERVCRPTVCVRETYSVPAMTNREIYLKHCD